MFVKPKSGVKVRRPVAPFTHVPPEGMEVPEDSYWIRRVQDGDLERGPSTHDEPTEAPAFAPTEEGKTR